MQSQPSSVARPGTPAIKSMDSPSAMTISKTGPSGNQTSGQAVLRLLQFAEQLSPGEQATDRSFWDAFVQDFFTAAGTLKMGLLNTETNKRKSFEVNQSLLARYFHTNYQCGVNSIQMTLEKTAEYIFPGDIMNVECPRVSFLHKYDNGVLVTSTGHLMVRFTMSSEGVWKIEHMEFSSQGYDEYIDRASIKSEPLPNSKKKVPPQHLVFPETPINKWGLAPRVFNILQISDIAEKLGEVVFHSIVSGTGPKESLGAIAYHKQQELSRDHDEDSKSQVFAMAPSPIVKTQTGARPQSFTPMQHQNALRQQQQQFQAAAAFQQFQQPHYQPAYPNNTTTNNQFATSNNTPTTSPMTRKRNSITNDVKSPVTRKRTNTGNRKQ
ncbi:LIM-domain binding protein-domain-containing protein [Sporodiniella umbellata]|nr:LIM-domain binding protein-domain-containing protein [Sporodiniella umbellata]